MKSTAQHVSERMWGDAQEVKQWSGRVHEGAVKVMKVEQRCSVGWGGS